MYANVRRGEKLMERLMQKGWTVICPHLSYHCWLNWKEDMPWERWIQMDEDFVRVADAFFYMQPEIFGESRGAKREYELAKKLGKTIYERMIDVPDIDPITCEIF